MVFLRIHGPSPIYLSANHRRQLVFDPRHRMRQARKVSAVIKPAIDPLVPSLRILEFIHVKLRHHLVEEGRHFIGQYTAACACKRRAQRPIKRIAYVPFVESLLIEPINQQPFVIVAAHSDLPLRRRRITSSRLGRSPAYSSGSNRPYSFTSHVTFCAQVVFGAAGCAALPRAIDPRVLSARLASAVCARADGALADAYDNRAIGALLAIGPASIMPPIDL